MEKKKLIVLTALVGLALITATRALSHGPAAQTRAVSTQGPSDEDIKLFRNDLRSLEKQIIAANMALTHTEAQQFSPNYDQYTAELVKIADRKYALLKDYSTAMDSERTNGQFDNAISQLRLKYFPIFFARQCLVRNGSVPSTRLAPLTDYRLSVGITNAPHRVVGHSRIALL